MAADSVQLPLVVFFTCASYLEDSAALHRLGTALLDCSSLWTVLAGRGETAVVIEVANVMVTLLVAFSMVILVVAIWMVI